MLRFAVLSAFTCASALTISSPAQAAPGLGQEVYGATVEEGEVELESRYDRLTGGPSAGESGGLWRVLHRCSLRVHSIDSGPKPVAATNGQHSAVLDLPGVFGKQKASIPTARRWFLRR